MNMSVVSQLEDSISQLPLSEQLWLIERLVQRIRENTISQQSHFEGDLVAMANDPEIQHELRLIEEEFTFAEADGLEIG